MASAGFMKVTADGVEIQGESSVTSQERENTIEVVEISHDVSSPVDSSTSSRSGQREHRVLRVTARVDKAVPLMYKAWSNNEQCEVLLRFFRPDLSGSGQEMEFFKISLTGASVAALKLHWPNSLRPETAAIPEQIEYAFTYERIQWESMDGNLSHEDQWFESA
jgi:type VI secretion system secreted protein Hcp